MRGYLVLFLIIFLLASLVYATGEEDCGGWTSSWKDCSPMPASQHGLSAVTYRNKIYVIGCGACPGLSFSDAMRCLHL